MNYKDYKHCIDACLQCEAACYYCASMDLKENEVEKMSHCIQLNMECAAICKAAANLMSLGSDKVKDICRLCAAMCRSCAAECGKHDIEHCRECAAACELCAQACEGM